jgi:hypothetical protein
MKKSLIALAVAGAMTAPVVAQADSTLYGTVAVDAVFKNDTSADIQVDDAIIGLKGTADLGLGETTGFYHIRTELKGDGTGAFNGTSGLTTDRALVGMTGGWGTLQAGAMGNPVDTVESLDAYADSYSTNNWFANPDDIQSAVAYVTPTMGGFSAYAGLVADGGIEDGDADTEDGDDANVDGYLVGFGYGIAGLSLDVGYWDFDEDSVYNGADGSDFYEADYIGVSIAYAINEAFNVTANWAESETDGSLTDYNMETTLWGLGADYTVGATTFGATYLDFEAEENGMDAEEGDEWGVYVNQALGNKAKVYAQYSSADLDDESVAGEDVFNVGYSISF